MPDRLEQAKRRGRAERRRPLIRLMALLALAVLALFSMSRPGQDFWRAAFHLSDFDSVSDAPFSIHVLDVGKADAILIQCEGHTALLDAGTSLSGKVIVDYLARGHVEALDFVIASHPDKDHIGGMAQVLTETEVKTFVRGSAFLEEYSGLETVLHQKCIEQKTVAQGDTLALGGATLQILGPAEEYSDTNNSSLVIRCEYQGFTALFCGDTEKEAEKDLVKSGQDLSADLLKVPHHGSKNSCTKRLLKAVSPKYAVISVGVDSNELPREETLLRLEDSGAEIYRTDVDGTVVFSYDGNNIQIQTEK